MCEAVYGLTKEGVHDFKIYCIRDSVKGHGVGESGQHPQQ